MRRVLVVVGLTVAAMLVSCGAATAQVPARDSVTGSATDCQDPPTGCLELSPFSQYFSLTADAHSGPAGENPTGTVNWRLNGGTPSSAIATDTQVSCLSVTGNVAIIGVTGSHPGIATDLRVPVAALVRVTDGGGPASGQDTFEIAGHEGDIGDPPLPGPTDCSSFPTGSCCSVNDEGNLVVHDAPPLPTSKDQCKNNGWRNFPGFNNQGQCVAFVNRGSPRKE
jgi:hypothetical protein